MRILDSYGTEKQIPWYVLLDYKVAIDAKSVLTF